MEKRLITGLLILLFSINVSGKQNTERKQVDKGYRNGNTAANEPIRGSPQRKMSSIEIEGNSSSVKVNNKLIEIAQDTLGNKDTILIDDAGNRISIQQKMHSSKVIISQKGNRNQISIIQK